MKNAEVVKFFEASLAECRDGIKSIRAIWEKNRSRYMCERDFSKKLDWQFKTNVPMAKPKSKRGANLIITTLLRAGEYFDFDIPSRSSNDPAYALLHRRCNITKRWVRAHLDAAPCSFIDNFSEALDAGFGYCGEMILKFWVGYVDDSWFDMPRNEYVQKERLALRCKAIDPWMFDRTQDGAIQIEHQYITLPELWKGVEKGDFDRKAVDKLMGTDYAPSSKLSEEAKARLARLGLDEAPNLYRKEVAISNFWGPLINKENKVEREHVKFIVANEKHIIGEVEDNPYPDKSTPYIYAPVIKVPFRSHGKALTEDVNAIEDAFNDFLMMQLDNGLWQMLGVTEIDTFSLTSHDKFNFTTLYPGVPIPRRSGSPELGFKRHEMGTDPSKAMPILNELKVLHDSDLGMEFISPNLPAMDISVTESSNKRQDAFSNFESIATQIERKFFKRCIDKGRDLLIQFMAEPDSDPKLEEIIGAEGAELANLSPEEKRALIVSEYQMVPRGISMFFERMRKLNAYTGLYKTLNALPDEAKIWIKWERFLPRVFEAIPIDSAEDLLNSPEEVAEKRKQMAEQQQMMIQAEMQKVMAPLQTKLQQTQMGIQERMTGLAQKIQADMQKQMADLSQRERERQTKLTLEALKTMLESGHRTEDRHMSLLDIGARHAAAMQKEAAPAEEGGA